jgi:hypothetical protein
MVALEVHIGLEADPAAALVVESQRAVEELRMVVLVGMESGPAEEDRESGVVVEEDGRSPAGDCEGSLVVVVGRMVEAAAADMRRMEAAGPILVEEEDMTLVVTGLGCGVVLRMRGDCLYSVRCLSEHQRWMREGRRGFRRFRALNTRDIKHNELS